MYLSSLYLLAAIGLIATGAHASITFPQPSNFETSGGAFIAQPPSNHIREMATHVASLGLNTLKDLVTGHSNVIISPLNVYSCLGILNFGAVGDTKEEIRRVLGPTDGNHTIREIVRSNDAVSYASALFLDHGFVPKAEFVDAAMDGFEASVLNVNVSNGEQAKKTINSWVSEHTNRTIENLLEGSPDPDTRMVIVTALLFKGKWLHAFPAAATARGKFDTWDSTVDVPFMHLLASVPLVRNPHFDAISLPYVDSHGMTMHVILPKTHGVHALKNLLPQLTPNSLRKLRKESKNEEIFIALPKMSIGGKFSLTNSLKKQGVSTMFNPSKANFTALSENSNGLFVSQIYHSIHFEMNEEGTVASAATASILTKSSRFIFRSNRPFIFVITDESNFILFLGVVVNPVP